MNTPVLGQSADDILDKLASLKATPTGKIELSDQELVRLKETVDGDPTLVDIQKELDWDKSQLMRELKKAHQDQILILKLEPVSILRMLIELFENVNQEINAEFEAYTKDHPGDGAVNFFLANPNLNIENMALRLNNNRLPQYLVKSFFHRKPSTNNYAGEHFAMPPINTNNLKKTLDEMQTDEGNETKTTLINLAGKADVPPEVNQERKGFWDRIKTKLGW